MILEEKMQRWVQNYCKACSDTCCNSQKHAILFDDSSLPLFQEKGIPVVRLSQLKEPVAVINGHLKLYLRDGSELKRPSVVQTPKGLFQREWIIYSEVCPFYNKEKGCEVHEDSRRPTACKQYPIIPLGCYDPEGKIVDIRVMNSCLCFNQEEIKSSFLKRFPVRIID